MYITVYYALGGVLLALFSAITDNLLLSLIFGWTSLSLLIVTGAYWLNKPRIFRKRLDGSVPVYVKWTLVPFLLGVQLYNSWARKNDSVPAIQEIAPGLFLACRLFPSDIEQLHELGVKHVLDVTAEFDGLNISSQIEGLNYLNIPVLDHQSPSEEDIKQAITWIDNQRTSDEGVVVHCALGRGRSVMMMAAYLLSLDSSLTVDDALKKINETRSTARLNKSQLRSLSTMHDKGLLSRHKKMAIIANPAAGGGKWVDAKNDILQMLSPHFDIDIYETSLEENGVEQAKKALGNGTHLVVACGGDGTVAEVASVAVGHNITLGILPMGTANALAHVLYGNGTKVMPIKTACDAIVGGREQTIDTAICNDELVLLLVGIGFEQQMIEQADRELKDENGQFAYLGSLYDAVLSNQSKSLTCRIDGNEPESIESGSLVVANAAPSTTVLAQGGGAPDFQDGKLDLTWLPKSQGALTSFAKLLALSVRGALTTSRETDDYEEPEQQAIQHQRIERIELSDSDTPIKYVIDGETRESETVKIKINPSSLKVVVA